jgi:DNA-binding SARP family transcriptional activator
MPATGAETDPPVSKAAQTAIKCRSRSGVTHRPGVYSRWVHRGLGEPLEVRILGPLEVVHEGERIALGGAKHRALVALLALHAPNPVSCDRLIDELWGERPPHSALHAIQVYVSGIRMALRAGGARDDVVRTCLSAYALDVAQEQIDARRFERLIHDGRAVAAEDPRRARELLEDALALWRGSPLTEAEQAADAVLEAERLDELRLAATECLADIKLEAGEHAELVGTLQALVSRHPLRDQLRRQLMLALYRSGRQTEALAAYREACAALAELGLLPSPKLRELEEAILRHDRALEPRAIADPEAGRLLSPARVAPPPGDELSLVGRGEAMARLVALVEHPENDHRRLVVLRGEPGVGKTRLLREFAGWAAANGHLAPLTSAEDDEIVPYRPLSELVRAVVASARGAAHLNLLGPLAADLALLVPELADSPTRFSTDPGLTRTRLFEAVVQLVRLGATAQPLVILIDDAHSMGRATGTLVRALLASCADRRLAVVLAARDQQPRERSGLQDILRQFDATAIPLGGLTEADLETWLERARRAGRGTRQWTGTAAELRARTGGVPLLVQAALTEVTDAGATDTDRVRIDTLVAERRAALTQEANEILDVAAVAGLGIEPQVIAEVIGLDPVAVQAELHGIMRAPGLLVGGAPPQEYAWYHTLVRDAILSSISVGMQTRWREGLTGVLSERGRGLEAARHALDALHGQARAALRSVLFGVDEAIVLLAFETGEDLCRRALALAGHDVDAEIAVPLLARLGLCLALTGQRQAAEEAWQQAAERSRRAGRSDLLGRVALAPEPLGRATTDTPLRWALLQEAVALPDLEPRLQIELTCAWLEEGVMPQHAITDEELASRVVREARRHGESNLLLRSLKTAHTVARAAQRVNRDLSSELCDLAERGGNAEWQGSAHLLAFIDAFIMLDRADAERHLERFLRAASRAPSPRLKWFAALVPATWEMVQGEIEASNRHARLAAELGQSYGMADAKLAMLIHGFFVAYHAGRLAEVSELLAQQAAMHPELPAFTAGAGLAFAEAGDPETAATIRDRLFPAIAIPGVDETWPVAACLAAQLCFETNAPTVQCAPLRDALCAYPGRMAVLGGAVAECGPVERCVGLLTAAADPAEAVAILRSAASASRQFGATVWTRRIERDTATISKALTRT